MSFKHLTAEDRSVIATLLGEQRNNSYIARRLGVNRATVGREIARNRIKPRQAPFPSPSRPAILDMDCRRYRGSGKAQDKYQAANQYATALAKVQRHNRFYAAAQADKRARARRKAANRLRMRLAPGSGSWLVTYVRQHLAKGQWSPEQIAGDLRHNHGVTISPQTIYDYIYLCPDKQNLVKHLRHGGNPYRRRRGTRARIKARAASLPSIRQRPKIVEYRQRLGDLEGDTIVGLNKKDRILTHVDRANGECKLDLALGYSARKVAGLTERRLKRTPVRTITYDRGNEFADYERLAKQTNTRIYFADAYHSWERGSSENLNGLVRQYFPKRTDFKTIAPRRLAAVERKLNNRPRKRYNYRTPIQQRQYMLRSRRVGCVALRGGM